MNMCKELCPVFSGQCLPSECDIFKNKESDLYNENSILRDRITRLKLDNEILKKEINAHLKYISELRNRYEDARG